MTFIEAQDFFKSWGLYPSGEDTDGLNHDVIQRGINRCCYQKLLNEAKCNAELAKFCSRVIDCSDDSFYLSFNTWQSLERYWSE